MNEVPLSADQDPAFHAQIAGLKNVTRVINNGCAQEMRMHALQLLHEASAIDGMKPHLAMLMHKQGNNAFVLWHGAEVSPEMVAARLYVGGELPINETLAMASFVPLHELVGEQSH